MGTDTLEQFTCIGCEETVTEGDRYYEDSRWSDVQDDLICYGCYESDTEHASTLVTVHQDGFNRVLLGDHVIIDLGYGDSGLPDYLRPLLPDGWSGTTWVSTDGWRGYGNSISQFKNITKLADGWTTGWVDHTVSRKHLINDLLGELESQELVPPAPIHVLLEQTSNIFSTAIDIFVAESDAALVIEWLTENGYSVQQLQDAAN
jgi:hypothetical protein